MKNEQLYRRTIDVLSRAYLEGTLEHGNDCACAVGNLIAAANNFSFCIRGNRALRWFDPDGNWIPPDWYAGKLRRDTYCEIRPSKLLDRVGYAVYEIAMIEKAFESAGHKDKDGYLGLMQVVSVLDSIHEVDDPEITEQSRKRFVKEAV